MEGAVICMHCLIVFTDYDGPSISNGSPSPQINGSSTTQSIRSTRSDLSSQGNSTQVGVGTDARCCDWRSTWKDVSLILSDFHDPSISGLAGGRRGWPAVGPLRRDGPESKRHSSRGKDKGACQRKEEGAADGLDEEIRTLQQFLRHPPPQRTHQRPKDRAVCNNLRGGGRTSLF